MTPSTVTNNHCEQSKQLLNLSVMMFFDNWFYILFINVAGEIAAFLFKRLSEVLLSSLHEEVLLSFFNKCKNGIPWPFVDGNCCVISDVILVLSAMWNLVSEVIYIDTLKYLTLMHATFDLPLGYVVILTHFCDLRRFISVSFKKFLTCGIIYVTP